jgi:hypothetical protein
MRRLALSEPSPHPHQIEPLLIERAKVEPPTEFQGGRSPNRSNLDFDPERNWSETVK